MFWSTDQMRPLILGGDYFWVAPILFHTIECILSLVYFFAWKAMIFKRTKLHYFLNSYFKSLFLFLLRLERNATTTAQVLRIRVTFEITVRCLFDCNILSKSALNWIVRFINYRTHSDLVLPRITKKIIHVSKSNVSGGILPKILVI